MPKLTQVKISDLVASGKTYVAKAVKAAKKSRGAYLTKTDAKRLPKDLRDNFAKSNFAKSTGSVKTTDFAREFGVMLEAFANDADKNGDGSLSTTEAKAMPEVLQDNYANYLAAASKQTSTAGGYQVQNLTPPQRVKEHTEAFGKSKVTYEQALAKAVQAVAEDYDTGLPAFVREYGGPDGEGLNDADEIEAEVRQLLKNGTIELVSVDEEIPTGEENKDHWIFSVWTDGQGDNGIWGIVDRKTGETYVTNFN
jgi:hypothetical protein